MGQQKHYKKATFYNLIKHLWIELLKKVIWLIKRSILDSEINIYNSKGKEKAITNAKLSNVW